GLGVLQQYLFTKAGGSAVLDVRRELYGHLQTLSIPFFHKRSTGRLISSFISDVSVMQSLYSSTLVNLITDILRFAALLTVMFLIDPSLTWIAVACLPFYAILMRKVSGPVRSASQNMQEHRAEATGMLQEKISGIREIKAFTGEDSHLRSMGSSFGQLLRSRIKLTLTAAFSSISGAVSALCFILILWFGGRQVIDGTMELGVFIAFIGYMGRLFGPVNTFVSINTSIQTAMGAAERIFGILDAEPDIELNPRPASPASCTGHIRLDKVSFSYGDDSVKALSDVTLELRPGTSTALVGISGAGKSTLAMLLLRFYDPDTGSLSLDGRNLRDLDLSWYRRNVGVVFQDPFVFNTSIAENIAMGNPDASENEIRAAAEAANADDFIRDLPDGYRTITGERGVCLSGGQRQRVAIARALLKDPRIVILDEATSALDTESERKIQAAMNNLLRNRTSIIIAHRLSTVRNVDTIVVLESGKIIERGSYSELISRKGWFWRLHTLPPDLKDQTTDVDPGRMVAYLNLDNALWELADYKLCGDAVPYLYRYI
ncbi:MAG: ATP-binding cassette domain-containing protein, partial [Candidatus Aegiribacteria sp.]|nr:ATP-binding cassette domain-containing protein [Candidatus Aegiribacteria sp.]MBD3294233.1 ATP-binding cassette domain-containing protein [Candidatus Fermentibacteria bacterium]